MIENSKIDEALQEAYQQSEYWPLQPRIQILLGQNQPELETLLIDNNSCFACLITAHNPRSKPLLQNENREKQQKMIRVLESLNLRYLQALSIDPKGKWPDEQQLMVLDCDRELGKKLARQFDQNAIVHIEIDQLTELVFVDA